MSSDGIAGGGLVPLCPHTHIAAASGALTVTSPSRYQQRDSEQPEHVHRDRAGLGSRTRVGGTRITTATHPASELDHGPFGLRDDQRTNVCADGLTGSEVAERPDDPFPRLAAGVATETGAAGGPDGTRREAAIERGDSLPNPHVDSRGSDQRETPVRERRVEEEGAAGRVRTELDLEIERFVRIDLDDHCRIGAQLAQERGLFPSPLELTQRLLAGRPAENWA